MSEGRLKRFYDSDPWKAFRQQIILERGTTCEFCGKKMFAEDKMQLHHTPVELTEDNVNDVSVSMNPDNVKLICLKCHNKAHGRYCGNGWKRKNRAVYLVYGPPCSGKSTYVQQHMERGDLVVDMDQLYRAVSGCDIYDKPDQLKFNVYGLRSALIDQIKTRYGGFNTAWVIGGYPNVAQRSRLATALGAELIYIEMPKEICMKRLESCRDYRQEHKAEWRRYIDEWFLEFSP